MRCTTIGLVSLLVLSTLFAPQSPAATQKRIAGEINFVGANKEAKSSGVWIDGQYVGYLGELGGYNRLQLLPGEHEVVVRQAGYEDFRQRVTVEPGWISNVHPVMERDARFHIPDAKTGSDIHLDVRPERAAVFLDGNFVGHVEQFNAGGRWMRVDSGKHAIKIALPGYKAFETEISLLPRQKFTLKTRLATGSINDADPLLLVNERPAPVRSSSTLGAAGVQPK